jgi:hypothetical protein
MEKQIVEQIKKFIGGMRNEESQKDLHKTSYVRGYQSALSDVERIIDFAESLKVVK